MKETLSAETDEILKRLDELGLTEPFPKSVKKQGITIALVGEFNVGKTTIVNRILRASVLPTDVTPTTAVVTRILHGDAPALFVEMLGPKPTQIDVVNEQVIRQLIVAPNNGCREVQLLHPGIPPAVELIDTPGVNDMSLADTSTLFGLLPACDAVVLILSASALLKKSELAFLEERLFPVSKANVLIVINGCDRVGDSPEKIAANARARLSAALGPDFSCSVPIWVCSAKENRATEHAAEVPAVKVADSGLALLQRFLVHIHSRGDRVLLERAHFLLNSAETALKQFIHSDDSPHNGNSFLGNAVLKKLQDLAQSTREDSRELSLTSGKINRALADFLDETEKEAIELSAAARDPADLEIILQKWLVSAVSRWATKTRELWPPALGADIPKGSVAPLGIEPLTKIEELAIRGPLEEWLTKPLNQVVAFTALPFIISTLGMLGVAALVALPFVDEQLIREKRAEGEKQRSLAVRGVISELRARLESALRMATTQQLRWVVVRRVWESKALARALKQALAPSARIVGAEALLERVTTLRVSVQKELETIAQMGQGPR